MFYVAILFHSLSINMETVISISKKLARGSLLPSCDPVALIVAASSWQIALHWAGGGVVQVGKWPLHVPLLVYGDTVKSTGEQPQTLPFQLF